MDDAEKARDALNGTEIAGFKIRVDFSITNAAHRPTPGVYFHHGKATRPGFRLRESRRGGGGGSRGGGGDRYRDDRDRRDYYEDRDRYERRPPPSYYDRGNTTGDNIVEFINTDTYVQDMTSMRGTILQDEMIIIETERGTGTMKTGRVTPVYVLKLTI